MKQSVKPRPKVAKSDEGMLDEYDFSGGVRGKHHRAYTAGTNVVLLDSDIAEVFSDSDSVNRALRLLLGVAKETVRPKKAS